MAPSLELIQGMDPDMGLIHAGRVYSQAQHDWCEAFLRYKVGTPMRGQQFVTDGQARAQADIDVDLVGARIAYDYALLRYRAHLNDVDIEPPEDTN